MTAPDPLTVIARTLADWPHTHPETQARHVLQALQGLYVPPPPGSDRDALPEHLRWRVSPYMGAYRSTGCWSGTACSAAALSHPDLAEELAVWAERGHASCRRTRKQDMVTCTCPCHTEETS